MSANDIQCEVEGLEVALVLIHCITLSSSFIKQIAYRLPLTES